MPHISKAIFVSLNFFTVFFFFLCASPASAQVSGGTVRIAVSDGSSTDTIDPIHASSDFMSLLLAGMVGDTLTAHSTGNQVVGELAESWSVTDDFTIWTFNLRPNARFHSGKMLEAEDVVFSFGRFAALENRIPPAIEAIADIRIEDSHTVAFELKQPAPAFASWLASPKFVVISADSIPSGSEIDATGPYLLELLEFGVRATAQRWEDDWREHPIYFDAIEVIALPDETSRLDAIQSGEVDIVDVLSPRSLEFVARNPDLAAFASGLNSPIEFAMDVSQPPFENPRVREALKLAMDREGIVEDLMGGAGIAMHDFFVDPAQLGGLRLQSSYDPDRARAILLQENLRDLEIDLHVSDAVFGSIEIAEHFAASAARAGITVNVQRTPSDGYWSNTWAQKPFYATQWSIGGDPLLQFQQKFDPTSRFFEKTSDDQFLAETAEIVRDQGGVGFSRFRRAAEIAAENSGSLIAAAPVRQGAFRGDIGPVNGELGRYGALDSYRLPKRWSFEPGMSTPISLSPYLDCAEGECACAGTNTCDNSCCD